MNRDWRLSVWEWEDGTYRKREDRFMFGASSFDAAKQLAKAYNWPDHYWMSPTRARSCRPPFIIRCEDGAE